MSDTTFSSGTVIASTWLNDVNTHTYRRGTISVRQLGYAAVGDNNTNDTDAIQAALTAGANKDIDFGNGYTYLVDDTLVLPTGARLKGRSIIKAMDSAGIVGAVLFGDGCIGTEVTELEIDANIDNGGANFGIQFNNGSQNKVVGTYVHDTAETGIDFGMEEDYLVAYNKVYNCGRASKLPSGGSTGDHGVRVYTNTVIPLSKGEVIGNFVKNANRKGITSYSLDPRTVFDLTIANNTVWACALGGIYCATAAGVTQKGISITGNTLYDNYTDIELALVSGATISGNVMRTSDFAGFSAQDITEVSISGNTITDGGVHGIYLTATISTNKNLAITGNVIMNSNTTTQGFGAGIYLNNTVTSTVSGNTINDDAAKMTHGIIEGGTANNNVIIGNNVAAATSAKYTVVGTSTMCITHAAAFTGFNTMVPLNTVDINGGISTREKILTLANGANNNVALTSPGTFYVSNVPTGVHNVTGFSGGHDGRWIVISNYTGFTLTLTHNSGSSSAGNKIFCPNNVDYSVLPQATVILWWSPTQNAWNVK